MHIHRLSHRYPAISGCRMTPSNLIVLCMINLVAVAGFLVLLSASFDATMHYLARFNRIPVHTSRLSGQMWLDELVNGHPRRFYNEIGLCKHVFEKLIEILKQDAGLVNTQHVLAEEQLAIFLHYVHRGLSNCALQERFQRSADTITKYKFHIPTHRSDIITACVRCVHRVLNALTTEKVYGIYVKLLTSR